MKEIYLEIISFFTIFFTISFCGCFNNDLEEDWGDDGELQLNLFSDEDEMELYGSINVTYELSNIGDSDLRILYPIGPNIHIFDSNNNSVQWMGEVMPTPPSPKNGDLKVLRKGESKSFNYIINTEYWDLHHNESYRIFGEYISGEQDQITLPYWKGELKSNEIYINLK